MLEEHFVLGPQGLRSTSFKEHSFETRLRLEADCRGHGSWGIGQRSEVRGQKSEVRSQRAWGMGCRGGKDLTLRVSSLNLTDIARWHG